MKVYLVEVIMANGRTNSLEPIGIKTNWDVAFGLISGQVGLITEMVVDEVYPEGIGDCEHWHFGEEDET